VVRKVDEEENCEKIVAEVALHLFTSDEVHEGGNE